MDPVSASPPTSRGRSGRPPLTSRDDILRAARQVIERDGWEQLTVRRLAAELGVGAATLYHHVRDKDDLLIQLLDQQADEALRPDLPDDPRERIVVAATAIHDALAATPWAAEVLTVDGFLGRLGPSALALVEVIVAGAVACGSSESQAVDLFRNLWYFTVGEILVRARSRSGRATAADRDTFFPADLDAARFPHLAAIGDRWPELAAHDSFPEGLAAFVDGQLARIGPSHASRPSR